jgi:hypothetical protein
MGVHVKRKIHTEHQPELCPLKDRRDFVVQAKKDLLTIAKAVAAYDNADASVGDARSVLAPYLMRCSDFWYCGICNSYSEKKMNHSKREHHATMVKEQAHCPVGLRGCTVIIPALYNSQDTTIYSKLFREALEEARTGFDGRVMSAEERNSYVNVARRSTRVASTPPPPKRQKTTKTKTGSDPVESFQPAKCLIPNLDMDPKVLTILLWAAHCVDHTDYRFISL